MSGDGAVAPSEGNPSPRRSGNDQWPGGYQEVGIRWPGVKKFYVEAELCGAGAEIPSASALVDQFCFQMGPKVLDCEVGMKTSLSEKIFNFHRSL